MFGGDFGLPPGPRYGRRSTGGAPPVVVTYYGRKPEVSLQKRRAHIPEPTNERVLAKGSSGPNVEERVALVSPSCQCLLQAVRRYIRYTRQKS